MNGKIVLIDGHSSLNRAFYGVPDLTNSEGLHTNAVYGFLNIMLTILDEVTPKRTHDLLEKGRDQAMLSKALATIKTDCELDYSLEEAGLPELFNEKSFAMVKRLEFKSLLKRFDKKQQEQATKHLQVQTITSEAQGSDFLKKLYQAKPEVVGIGFLADHWASAGAQ